MTLLATLRPWIGRSAPALALAALAACNTGGTGDVNVANSPPTNTEGIMQPAAASPPSDVVEGSGSNTDETILSLQGGWQAGDRLVYTDGPDLVYLSPSEQQIGRQLIRRDDIGARTENRGYMYPEGDGEFPADGTLDLGDSWETIVKVVGPDGIQDEHRRACDVIGTDVVSMANMPLVLEVSIVECSFYTTDNSTNPGDPKKPYAKYVMSYYDGIVVQASGVHQGTRFDNHLVAIERPSGEFAGVPYDPAG